MASPWETPQHSPVERPWMGMALLVAIPVLALVLIRMLWSGSSLWFLTVGIILLGAAAVLYLARRPQELEFEHRAISDDFNRGPLILVGLGVLFLAMLLLPNFSGGGSAGEGGDITTTGSPISDVADTVVPPAEQEPVDDSPPAVLDDPIDDSPDVTGDQTYIVVSGDTVWDIAQRFSTTVESILTANDFENPSELQVGQELIIVAPSDDAPVTDPVEEPVDSSPVLDGDGIYIVVEGDSLWTIAEQFSVTVDGIIDVNALESPKELQVGQKLLIPTTEPSSAEALSE